MHSHWHLAIAVALIAAPALAVSPTKAEIARAHAWLAAHFDGKKAAPPFSFTFGGKSSAELLKSWKVSKSHHEGVVGHTLDGKLDKDRSRREVTYSDPATGLAVTCRATEYRDFPTVEWTLVLKNTGTADTPIIEDIRPMDVTFGGGAFKLHWNTADNCAQDSYAPHADDLAPGTEKQFASAGGRPTSGGYPYYNIEMGKGGIIAVLSWGGQWSSRFKREGDTLNLRAGQELTRFALHPGEEVSSPLAILQFYDGDWIRSQNIWRRWMVAHNMPRPGGKPVSPFRYGCDGDAFPNLVTNAKDEIVGIDKFHSEGTAGNTWDVDAGWYPCGDAWWNTGTWEPDPKRYPKGLKEVSDHLRSRGQTLMLWFEPERCAGGSWLTKNHPEWVYGGANGGLVKYSDAEAWKWITERVDSLITSEGVGIYRQDFNIDPLGYWRGNDAPDRQGITEIRHVEAYYRFWDMLLQRHPNLLIDTCASGGRRNNVETLRRSVPVLRSDYTVEPIGNQGHTYGLSMWVPFYGTGQYISSAYNLRSCFAPIFGIGGDFRKQELDWDLGRRTAKEWGILSRYMLGDFYPMTPYSLDKKDWIAWQFDVLEKGEGYAIAFRRDDAPSDTLTVKLQGLDPRATYNVENLDTGKSENHPGRELMSGLTVTVTQKPGSGVVLYRKTK